MHKSIKKIKPSQSWIIDDSNPIIRSISTKLDVNNITKQDWEEISKLVSFIDSSYDMSWQENGIKPGIAITGVQIGYTKRVCYVHFDDENGVEQKLLLINPEFVETSYEKSYLEGGEGCLSVPVNKEGIVPRNHWIKIKYFDLDTNDYKTIKLTDMVSICVQHEMDHMDGKLYYDRINIFKPDFADESWVKIK